MIIGTWNVGRRLPTVPHIEILFKHDCDVWLLTEIHPDWLAKLNAAGFHLHHSSAVMQQGQYWAAILSCSPMEPDSDPHPASAAAVVNGTAFCSSILPWQGAEAVSPWEGASREEMVDAAIRKIVSRIPAGKTVWGGDWNQSLVGRHQFGTIKVRQSIKAAMKQLKLHAPTASLSHQKDGYFAIDHIAVPTAWPVRRAQQIRTSELSDHDAYVVEVCRL